LTGASAALFQTAIFGRSATSLYFFADNSSRQPLTVALVQFTLQRHHAIVLPQAGRYTGIGLYLG
jgi:hypothetical protein